MPYSAQKICNVPNCYALTHSKYCDEHTKEHSKWPDKHRDPIRKKFYDSTKWRKLRRVKLSMNPLCQHCLKRNITKAANVVDHIKTMSEGGEVLNIENLQSLCKYCHDSKTSKEINARRKNVRA